MNRKERRDLKDKKDRIIEESAELKRNKKLKKHSPKFLYWDEELEQQLEEESFYAKRSCKNDF